MRRRSVPRRRASADAAPTPPPRRDRMVGVLQHRRGGGVVEPFDPSATPIHVSAAHRGEARDGDAVVVEILHGPQARRGAEGRVTEVLGRMDEPGVDVLVVARRHGLASVFPEGVLREARALRAGIPEAEAQRRERFQEPAPVTIDGETARDFDDAIAVSELPRGGFRLFVHIADVAHFVRRGSALDREALQRGTSVYFPDRVLPMFPERLSNDLCSLRPEEERLVQSVVLDLDRLGRVLGVRFADGVIRSGARLTYTQVASLLDGTKRVPGIPGALHSMLHLADRLRDVLEARRHARGSVDFDLPEPRILLDVEGAMTGITVEPRNRAHRMIEEFMLVANEAVAAHLAASGAPCLYRVHEKPDPVKVEGLAAFARGFGLDLAGDPEAITPRDIQRLLEAAEGRPEYPILAQVALRSMKQARYMPENIGHFGLAAPVYAHFTSPIRRYPDLVVHRALRALRGGRRDALDRLAHGLGGIGDDCSRLEREAEAAERELLEWKKIAFIRERTGQVFDGVVTGVTRFGLFVQLTENLVEGLLHVARLPDDRYEFLENRMELRGARTRHGFRLGDRLRVALDRVDPLLRRVDLSLAQEAGVRPPARAEAGRPRLGGRARGAVRGRRTRGERRGR